MNLYNLLWESIKSNKKKFAFYIKDTFYSYEELANKVSAIRVKIKSEVDERIALLGLVANDDIETYAAIIAIWLEGKAYVPLSVQMPLERNLKVINQAGVQAILDSSSRTLFSEIQVINTNQVYPVSDFLPIQSVSGDSLSYILFTSGSTGSPKGVQISIDNLTSFVEAFLALGFDFNSRDRWLQMFELTFDLSIMSYLFPLLSGACVYTVPQDRVKFNYAAQLLEDQQLTVAMMVPSLIQYLRPYYEELNCTSMRYNFFCGEALSLDITDSWSKCVPNAEIYNVYGPTETTLFCTAYKYDRLGNNRSYNGTLSIGHHFGCNVCLIDEMNNIVGEDRIGELCIAGPSVFRGYVGDADLSLASFISLDHGGRIEKFYKTGDLCFIDKDFMLMYAGRIDSQVKVQGYRIELAEVEFYAKKFLSPKNVVAISFENENGANELGLIIEGQPFDTDGVRRYFRNNAPFYMYPTAITFENQFPQNNNGKTDRKELKKRFLNR